MVPLNWKVPRATESTDTSQHYSTDWEAGVIELSFYDEITLLYYKGGMKDYVWAIKNSWNSS